MRQADNPPEVFRLARKPDPWAWPEWAYSAADGTFGNRYDDPRGTYRVLYRIDLERHIVTVVSVTHRADAYRSD